MTIMFLECHGARSKKYMHENSYIQFMPMLNFTIKVYRKFPNSSGSFVYSSCLFETVVTLILLYTFTLGASVARIDYTCILLSNNLA